jgi:catalase
MVAIEHNGYGSHTYSFINAKGLGLLAPAAA